MPRTDRMKTHGELLAEELQRDEDFRVEWESLELARIVAAEVIRYRATHNLSQRKLADRLGVSQPQVARLEAGEHVPGFETLVNLSRQLQIEFLIDIGPATQASHFVTRRTREAHVARDIDGVSVLVATHAR